MPSAKSESGPTASTATEPASSSPVPPREVLDKVADHPVFDQRGERVPFKSLYWAQPGESRRVLIIFIRHFFCGVSPISPLLVEPTSWARQNQLPTPSNTSCCAHQKIELPGVRTNPDRRTPSFLSATQRLHRHCRLRLPQPDIVLYCRDRLSVPDLRRPYDQVV